jgi:hypothetical protein
MFDPICWMPEVRSAPNSIRQFTVHRLKQDRFMKKKNRIEIDRKIVSRVKREMDEPRLTESVRKSFSARNAPDVSKPTARSARA